MSAPPGLSVVVPTHNTRELTLRCLASVQAARADEIVVVDDGSRDGTAEAVTARHAGVTLLRSEQARGFSAAVNQGLAAARGELLWLLNSDTELPEHAAERVRAAFAADARLGAVGPRLVGADGLPQWSAGRFPTLAWLFAMASGLPAWASTFRLYRARPRRARRSAAHEAPVAAAGVPADWLTGAALALRRTAWQQVGPLDEGFGFYGQDLDLCRRLWRVGWRVAWLPDLHVLHHGGATIGRRDGVLGGAQIELLWTDLAREAEKAAGPGHGRRARLALWSGSGLRVAWRRLCALGLSPTAAAAFRHDTQTLQRARRALLRSPGGAVGQGS